MDGKYHKKFRYVWMGGFLCLIVTLAALFSMILICILLFTRNKTEPKSILFENKVRSFDPSTNESSSGFVSIYENLGVGEYISYKDVDGKQVLVSGFGSNEYQCTGSCYCNEDENRRFTTTYISRIATFLVAAVTLSVAYYEAKGFFEGECIKDLENTCSKSSITAEIDSCKNIEDIEDGIQRTEQEEQHYKSRMYFCRGNCAPKNFQKEGTRQLALEFGCEKLHYEGEMEVQCSGIDFWEIGEDNTKIKKNLEPCSHDLKAEAVSRFQKEHLIPFCKENSREKYLYRWEKDGQKKNLWNTVILCVGGTSYSVQEKSNVHCVDISRKKS